MSFSDRAVNACVRSMEKGVSTERQVRDVLRCEDVDVQPFVEFLDSPYPMVRKFASRIVGSKSDSAKTVFEAALREKEKDVLLEMLAAVAKCSDSLEALEGLLAHGDWVVREGAITMFRLAGQASLLFPLLFDEDDEVVQRIKRYINEQERQDSEESGS